MLGSKAPAAMEWTSIKAGACATVTVLECHITSVALEEIAVGNIT